MLATPTEVRVVSETGEVARHPRSWGRRKLIECPEHLTQLAAEKQAAAQGRATHRLLEQVGSAAIFLGHIASTGGNLGGHTYRLVKLLDQYGAAALEAALVEVNRSDSPSLSLLHRRLDDSHLEQKKKVSIPLPEHIQQRDPLVRGHDLARYDRGV